MLTDKYGSQGQVAERWYVDKRTAGLARFAIAITVLNILGHLWLGFEQAWATPFVTLAAAYATELLAETAASLANHRHPRFLGSVRNLIVFLLPAHITGLAVGMLLYPAEQLWIMAFTASIAIASKWLIRIRIRISNTEIFRSSHVLNPSNFAISATLILFPSVGLAPPYQFSENISGALDWLFPAIVIVTGSLLNTKLTGRMPLILAWFGGFAIQAITRAFIHDTPILAGLMPMTGFAFILFSFYMITDPATTPSKSIAQVVFGTAVAAGYALFMETHIVFGMFYSLTLIAAARGLMVTVHRWLAPDGQSNRVFLPQHLIPARLGLSPHKGDHSN